ncbi:MAG: Protein RnfH [Proteobacteria bacterium]|nr:MAG: Protein RnfH [Pseudomonadota bacterium]
MTNQDFYNVQVVYALKDTQTVIELQVKPGTTILKAIESSGIKSKHPEIDLENLSVGIFAKLKTPETELQDGDRVEIYRELLVTKKVTKTNSLKVEI